MNLSEEIGKLSDKEVKILLKSALEFNAAIISLATMYLGNMDTLRQRQRFAKDYKKQIDWYENFTKELLSPDDNEEI